MIFSHKAAGIVIGLAVALSASSAFAGTRPNPVAKGAASLAAQHWDLVEWSGKQLPRGKPLRLDFDAANGRFSTETGCNRAAGAYTVKGSSLRFGNRKGGFASTLMACPEPAMAMERAYVDSLSAVTRYSIAGDTLVLRTAKGKTLTYRAAHKPAADAPRKFIYVSGETRPCTGVAPMTCLQVREAKNGPWELHYGGIADFEPQPGIEYRLRIIEEKIDNPPADASSIRWTLDQVIEQHVVTP
jgi:heat shock protein HslJ